MALKKNVFEILLSLLSRELHGYALVKALEAQGGSNLLPANLYRTLREMERAGWIEESGTRPDPEIDDQRRRYFRITDSGRGVAREEALRLEALLSLAHHERLIPSRTVGCKD